LAAFPCFSWRPVGSGAILADFLSELKRRVLVYDGAMGSNVQKHNLTAKDFWGKEGCNELLVLSRPEVIRSIHAAFLEAG
jgi:5-methyltetrahydrofolate--homocysteine methyltransferase